MTMRQSVMLSDLDVPGSDSASTVALNQTEAHASSAAPPSPLWRAAFALAAAEEASPVSAALRRCSQRPNQTALSHREGQSDYIAALRSFTHVAAVCAAYHTCTRCSQLHPHHKTICMSV